MAEIVFGNTADGKFPNQGHTDDNSCAMAGVARGNTAACNEGPGPRIALQYGGCHPCNSFGHGRQPGQCSGVLHKRVSGSTYIKLDQITNTLL